MSIGFSVLSFWVFSCCRTHNYCFHSHTGPAFKRWKSPRWRQWRYFTTSALRPCVCVRAPARGAEGSHAHIPANRFAVSLGPKRDERGSTSLNTFSVCVALVFCFLSRFIGVINEWHCHTLYPRRRRVHAFVSTRAPMYVRFGADNIELNSVNV